MHALTKFGLISVGSGIAVGLLGVLFVAGSGALPQEVLRPYSVGIIFTAMLMLLALPLVGVGIVLCVAGLVVGMLRGHVHRQAQLNTTLKRSERQVIGLYLGALLVGVFGVAHGLWWDLIDTGSLMYWVFSWFELLGAGAGLVMIALAGAGIYLSQKDSMKLVGLVLIVLGGALQATTLLNL